MQLAHEAFVPRETLQTKTVLIIQRQGKRELENHDETVVLFRRLFPDWEIDVWTNSRNGTGDRDAFARARIVFGPHGAGHNNLIFCQPGTVVFEVCSHCPWRRHDTADTTL